MHVYTCGWTLDETYVFVSYPVVDGQASIGPPAATTWRNGPLYCTALEGHFTRNGFGRWVVLVSDEFEVAAA